jgi:hypothetical protein
MKKNQCINCGQLLKPAPSDSEWSWIGKTDNKETCFEGATQMANGEWVSEQDHCTQSEMG